jgi:hypothetical protein
MTRSPVIALGGKIFPRTTAAALTAWLYSSGTLKIGEENAHAVPSKKYTTAVAIPTVAGARDRNNRAQGERASRS